MKQVRNNSRILAAVALAAAAFNTGCNGGSAAPPPAVTVSISPSSAQSVDPGQSIKFTATVNNDSSNKGVTWTLTQNNTACSPGCGTISPANTLSGAPATYAAPAAVNANLQFSVTATSVADTSKSASESSTAVPVPTLNNPAQLPDITVGQPYSYTLTETGGVPPFTWSITAGALPAGLTLNSSTGVISGTPSGAAAGLAPHSAAMATPQATSSASFTAQVIDSGNPQLKAIQALSVKIIVPAITVSIAPTSATLPTGAPPFLFTATVGNDVSTQGVTWSITQGGAACVPACGTLAVVAGSNTQINYVAPALAVPNPPTVTLTATSVADTTKSATATITITRPAISVTVSTEPGCSNAGVPVNGTCLVYSNIMNDSGGKGVTWSLNSATGCPGATCGTILPRRVVTENTPVRGDYEMLYFGPDNRLSFPPTVTVIATSVADPSKSGSAAITLTSLSPSIGVVSPLISSNAASTTGGSGDSYEPVVNIDGSAVAFTSTAPDLVSSTTITQPEVFFKGTCINQPQSCLPLGTIIVSVNSSSQVGNGGPSHTPSINFTSGVVGFLSGASDLDPTITNPGPPGLSYAYAADTCGSAAGGHCIVPPPHLISVDQQKNPDGGVGEAIISPDGRWMMFHSGPGEVVENPLNPASTVVSPGSTYIGDACTGAAGSCVTGTVTYLHDRNGNPVNGGELVASQITSAVGPGGGGFVVFVSNATNLVPGVTSGNPEIYEINVASGLYFLVSQDNSGKPAPSASSPSVSADGRFVSFLSTGLVPNDTNGHTHVYVRDTCLNVLNCTPTTTLVDVATGGPNAGKSSLASVVSAGSHAISGDGRYVAFYAINPSDLTSVSVASTGYFVRDMSCASASAACPNGGINLVSVSSSGAVIQGNSAMDGIAISGDGQYAALTINAGEDRLLPTPNFHAQVVIAATGFPVTPGTPAITYVTPNIGQQGNTLSSVMITGEFTHFTQGASAVSFAPDTTITASNITVTDATHLTATVMIPPSAAIGAQTVTVTTSATTGTETASLSNGFTVALGAPVISQVTPSFGQQGATLSNVMITGLFTHFMQGASAVSFAPDTTITASNITVTDATHLTATLMIPPSAATGAQTVKVTTGTEMASLPNAFSVTAAAGPPPLVISTTVLANGAVNSPYDGPPVTALGGTSPYTWTETTGLFDPATGQGKSGACVGLTLGFASTTLSMPLNGRPTSAGTCGPFTLKITDSSNPSPRTATRMLSVNITMPVTRFAFTVNSDTTISTYAVNSATGQLRASGYSLAADTSFSTTLIKNKFFLTRPAGFPTYQVTEYTFDPLTGAINVPATTPSIPKAVGGDVVAHPTGNFLYYATGDVLSIDLTTGALSPITNSPFPMPGTGGNVAMDPAGKFFFAGIQIAALPNQIAAFSVDATTGALTIAPGSPFSANYACANPNCPLAVDPSGQFLYIPYSPFSPSTLSPGMDAFRIDPTTGALSAVTGSPLAMPGSVQGMALTSTSIGEFLYVIATPHGSSANSPNVYGFQIDTTSGALTALPAPFPTFNNAIPLSVDVDPTGKFLYVNGRTSNITPTASGTTVSVFQIQPNGNLTLASTILNQHGSTLPMLFSTGPEATFAPSFLLAANAGSTSSPVSAGNVSSFVVDPVAGSLAGVANSPFAAGNNPSSVALDRLNRFAVVSNLGDNTISAFTVGADGSLTSAGTAVMAGMNPADLIIDPTGRFVYAVNRGDGTLSAYSLDQTTGQLTSFRVPGTPNGLARPTALAMDPSGLFFYVANSGGSSISIYKVLTLTTGALMTGGVISLTTGATPQSLVVDPSGHYLYMADAKGAVEAFSIDSSGQLSPLTSSPTPAGTMTMSVAADPTAHFLYAANQGSADVSGYDIAFQTGALTQFTSSPFMAGKGPVSLAVDPSGRFLYVANQTDGTIAVFSIDPMTGALTPAAMPTFGAGVNPAKVVVGEIIQ